MTGKVTAAAGSTTVTETRTINDLNQITYNTVAGATTVDWTFTYDVLGRMLSRTDTSGTTTFVWDGMNCVMETDYLGNVTRYYIPNGMLMSFDRTVSAVTSTYQIHADGLGSIRKVTDSSGTVQATFDYDSWGNALASTSDLIPNGGLQYRFVGAMGVRWDAATGLYYMRARWYDPGLGRFLSRDPLRSIVAYTYAADNPTTLVDPSGQKVYVTMTDGSVLVASNAAQLQQILAGAGYQQIADIAIYGHGGWNETNFDINNPSIETSDFLRYQYTGPVYGSVVDLYSINSDGTSTLVGNFADMIRGLLAPNATIEFNGCLTAAGQDNLTLGLYNNLYGGVPGVSVGGNWWYSFGPIPGQDPDFSFSFKWYGPGPTAGGGAGPSPATPSPSPLGVRTS